MSEQPSRTYGHAFGPDAPSKNLPFASSAKLTAVELLTFFPHCLRSPNVVYRFASNSGSRGVLWAIIANNRYLERNWAPNDCGRLVSQTMRQAGYTNWTITTHARWHRDRANWDKANLSVEGYKVPCQSYGAGSLAQSISFLELAAGVRTFPEGHDSLDLTRMVKYALEHSDGLWRYPYDYDVLLRLVGGPKTVEQAHWDESVFRRWEQKQAGPQMSITRPSVRKKVSFAIDDDPTIGCAEPERIGSIRNNHSNQQAQIMDEVSKTTLSKETNVSADENQALADDDCTPVVQPHIRKPPAFIPPPIPLNVATEAELELAFRETKSKAQTDKYSAYAFGGGPRTSPPYRQLHRIHSPESDDISVWAENLRWVAEQVKYFQGAYMWDESPEHMEIITDHRVRQEWMSEEYWEVYAQSEKDSNQGTNDSAPRRLRKERIVLQDVVPDTEKISEYLQCYGLGAFPPSGETFFGED
ncbi:uncharacterized protein EI97DRAFT_480658 [Westerdykella ornata]|uniref:Uncharacterized protein n=1 Tax=Westerdykella ornata TaxID=318751 RepID=A0A6A6JAJ1_WESOR|nr:uncharacterized protein EI97DRAFT_480658 [Westerdykella ornata]KAF2273611.1 hypothetical protein EI97DRAFT_480658 [Westerdykella ornata]